jgi:predicted nucleic acid-binding protein
VKVLVDTNVILDVWLAREPFWRDSAKLIGKMERKDITGVICPTTITTLHYLGKKILGEEKARRLIRSLLEIAKVGNVSKKAFRNALESKISDFEDAVIESVAIAEKVDFIASRNLKDFKKSQVKAKEPADFV